MVALTRDTIKPQSISPYFAGVWFVYLVMKPVYVLPHGLPQISDAVLLAGLLPGMIFIFLGAGARASHVALTGGLFAALTCAVNLVNYIFTPDMKLILSAVYYIYNFMIFLFVVWMFRQDAMQMARITIFGIVMSLFVQMVATHMLPPAERMTGGFTNPNQLAYWALLSAAMLVFLSKRFHLIDFSAIGMAGYLQTLALSKAGLITFGLFLLLLVFIPQVPRYAKMTLLFIVVIGVSCFTFSNNNFNAAERVTNRLQSIGMESDDSLNGRGYDRMVKYPEYLLAGAGEGGFERFRQWGGPDELHSGLATILFSYGILGLGFFGAFLYSIFNRQPWYAIALLGIVLLFGVTSQTIRFTHSWVFFGIAYGSFVTRRAGEAGEPGAPRTIQAPQSG